MLLQIISFVLLSPDKLKSLRACQLAQISPKGRESFIFYGGTHTRLSHCLPESAFASFSHQEWQTAQVLAQMLLLLKCWSGTANFHLKCASICLSLELLQRTKTFLSFNGYCNKYSHFLWFLPMAVLKICLSGRTFLRHHDFGHSQI